MERAEALGKLFGNPEASLFTRSHLREKRVIGAQALKIEGDFGEYGLDLEGTMPC